MIRNEGWRGLVNYFKFKPQNTCMPKVIDVVYESGVFKPLEKVDLKEGIKLKIEIKERVSEI